MSDTILFEQRGAIATMTFNRPEVFNAMSTELIARFASLTNALKTTPDIRVLILKGAGKAFIAGGDVGMFYKTMDTIVDTVKPIGDQLHAGIINLRQLPFPVVAEIQGAVAGAGLSVALACDFAIASENATFTTAYSKIGLSPDGGSTYFLPRLVGIRKATELVMLSDSLTAAEALQLGLINRVVPHDALATATQEFVARLANGPTQAYARAKRLLTQSFDTPIAQQLDDEMDCFAECAGTADFREGVTAFVEKRKPIFTGK